METYLIATFHWHLQCEKNVGENTRVSIFPVKNRTPSAKAVNTNRKFKRSFTKRDESKCITNELNAGRTAAGTGNRRESRSRTGSHRGTTGSERRTAGNGGGDEPRGRENAAAAGNEQESARQNAPSSRYPTLGSNKQWHILPLFVSPEDQPALLILLISCVDPRELKEDRNFSQEHAAGSTPQKTFDLFFEGQKIRPLGRNVQNARILQLSTFTWFTPFD